MNQFATSINLFLTKNQFSNNIDGFGNVNLNISASALNQECIAIGLKSYEYDNDKITNLYDTVVTSINSPSKNDNIQSIEDLKNSYKFNSSDRIKFITS